MLGTKLEDVYKLMICTGGGGGGGGGDSHTTWGPDMGEELMGTRHGGGVMCLSSCFSRCDAGALAPAAIREQTHAVTHHGACLSEGVLHSH